MTTLSKYSAYQQASLGQKVSFNIGILRYLAGSDQELGDSIAVLTYLSESENMKVLEKDPLKWVLGLLDYLRLSHFANSEKTDILTKLSFLYPKKDELEDWSEDESG